MRKIFALLLSVAAFASVSAYDASFTVVNIAKDNVDATVNEPRIGDSLFFSIDLTGSEPISGEKIAVDVSSLKNEVTFLDLSGGTLNGDMIEFADLNKSADLWEEQYGFYARVNDTNVTSIMATFNDTTLNIPLNLSKETRCDDCDLTETGPESLYMWILAAFVFFAGIIGLAHFKKS